MFTFIIGFVLCALVVLFIIIGNGKSHRRRTLRLDLDLIVPPYRPASLCPSLVKIEIDVHGKKYMNQFYKPNPASVGFIVKSEESEEEGLTTVWGQSWCLYDPDEATKVLRKVAKVTVILQDKQNCLKRFDGIVTYVDFDFDLAIIVFKHPKHLKIPELPTFGNFIDKHILSCDFHFNYPWNNYLVEPYTLKSSIEVQGFKFKSSVEVEDLVEGDDDDNDDDLQQFHKCGSYFHVEKKYCTAGVLLDATNLNIVGMKFGKCHSMELAHVLPIQEIVARLHHKSQTNDHTDIQPRLIMEDSHPDIPTPLRVPPMYVAHQAPIHQSTIML